MQPLLHTETRQEGVVAITDGERWPLVAHWASVTEDRILFAIYRPLFDLVGRASIWLRGLHPARVTTSLLYIVGTMVLLLTLLFLPGAGR